MGCYIRNARWIFWAILFLLTLSKRVKCMNDTELNNGNSFRSRNCTLMPERKRSQLYLDKLIDDNNRLIKLSIVVKWDSYPPNKTYPEHMLLYMTTDASGQHLLLLDDHFEDMSLGTLSHGVAEMNLSLVQEPSDCLGNLTADTADKHLKFALLRLPRDPKALNEDEVSILHICTGTVSSNGNCCNLTIRGNDVRCEKLEDVWLSKLNVIVLLLSIYAFSHCIYLIPKSVFEKDNDHSYTILNSRGNLRLTVIKGNNFGSCSKSKSWTRIVDLRNPLLRKLIVKLEKYLTATKLLRNGEAGSLSVELQSVKKAAHELVSEDNTVPELLQNIFKTLNDIFLYCKIRDAESLRGCCYHKPFENCPRCLTKLTSTLQSISCFKFLIVISKLSYGILLFIPVLVRIVIMNNYNDPAKELYIFCIVYFFFFFLLLACSCTPFYSNASLESLKIIHDTKSGENAEIVLSTLFSSITQYGYSCKGILLMPFSILFGLFLLLIFSLPVFHFLVEFYLHLLDKGQFYNVLKLSVCVSCIGTGTFVVIESVVFYAECLAYIIMGFLLNYEQVIDLAILILMVSTYAFNCLGKVYKKLNDFNRKVISLVYELSQDTIKEMIAHAAVGKNVMGNVVQTAFPVKICFGEDGQPFLSAPGLCCYYKFEDSNHLPYLHIPESFLDQLASKPGHPMPGLKYVLLIGACKEIIIMILGLSCIFIIISGSGGINDIPTGVHTLVTFGSSAAWAMFNRLVFSAKEYSINDREAKLKQLINVHAREFHDFWVDAEFRIHSQEHQHTSDLSTSFEQLMNSDSISDIVFEVYEDDIGKDIVMSCYVKSNESDLITCWPFLFNYIAKKCRRKIPYETV